MVNPRTQTTIHGEGNIARYMARLLTPSYDDEGDVVAATVIDQWVDSAAQFAHGNNKERAAVLKSMNAYLGNHEWMVGQSLTLADVILWGVITQAKEDDKAPSNVKKWYQRCCEIDAFKTVKEKL